MEKNEVKWGENIAATYLKYSIAHLHKTILYI